MEPTVLAGAIEFSPAEIALILAVLAAAALVVTSPGWMVLAVVMGRRVGPQASTGRRWAARVGGALLGMALTVAAASLLNALAGGAQVVAVLSGWLACWAVAALLHRRRVEPPVPPASAVAPTSPTTAAAPTTATAPTTPTAPTTEGWGR